MCSSARGNPDEGVAVSIDRYIEGYQSYKLSIAQNHYKNVSFLLKYGTFCAAGKYMAPLRICEIISIAIFRVYLDLGRAKGKV